MPSLLVGSIPAGPLSSYTCISPPSFSFLMSDPRRTRDPRRKSPQPPPPPPAAPPPPPDTGLDGASDDARSDPQDSGVSVSSSPEKEVDFKLKFCTVCASNNNRSMEAHLRLSLANYPVISFGTGSLVRLPGPSITQPYVYPFNTTSYSQMHDELQAKDARLNRANGVLNMLERNRTVKFGPERWQDWPVGKPRLERFLEDKGGKGIEGGVVDVVFTCEERCWEAVVENLLERGSPLNRPVHVINVDIKDSHEEALVGGKAILDLANALNTAAREEREKTSNIGWQDGSAQSRTSFDQRVPDLVGEWQGRWPHLPALWTLAWF